jgi:cell wall-associated NlpC family hydrolase
LPLKPAYLVLAGVGGIVAIAGVKGWGISGTLKDVLSGTNPASNPPQLTAQITGATFGYGYGSFGAVPGEGASGIAALAEAHIGFPYTWGGAPARGSSDCSGFVNWIVGHLAGMAIPGYAAGTYTGAAHGPPTVSWLAWNGCARIPRSQAQAGDLAVWQTHMGIITDNGQNMVSDLNPSLGTRATTINDAAPPGEILFVERLKATAAKSKVPTTTLL